MPPGAGTTLASKREKERIIAEKRSLLICGLTMYIGDTVIRLSMFCITNKVSPYHPHPARAVQSLGLFPPTSICVHVTRHVNFLPNMALASAPFLNTLWALTSPSTLRPYNHQPTGCHRGMWASGLTLTMWHSCAQWPPWRPKDIGVTMGPSQPHMSGVRLPWKAPRRHQAGAPSLQKPAGTDGIRWASFPSKCMQGLLHFYVDQEGLRDRQSAQSTLRIWLGWCQEDCHRGWRCMGCIPWGEHWDIPQILLTYMLPSPRVARMSGHSGTRSHFSYMRGWLTLSVAPVQLAHMQCILALLQTIRMRASLPLPSTQFSWINLTQVSSTERWVFHSHFTLTNMLWNI